MRILSVALLVLSVGLFIGSGLTFVVQNLWDNAAQNIAPVDPGFAPVRSPFTGSQAGGSANGFAGMLLGPVGPVLGGLLVFVWLAALGYALRVTGLLHLLLEKSQPFALHLRFLDRIAKVELPALIVAFSAAALLPWIPAESTWLRFVLAMVFFAGATAAALCRVRARPKIAASTSLGLVAGWATIALCTTFSALLHQKFGMSPTVTALLALLICSITAVWVQLQIGAPFAYSLAVIWGLLGIAVATMAANMAIALATVIAITLVSLALVRVTT